MGTISIPTPDHDRLIEVSINVRNLAMTLIEGYFMLSGTYEAA
jgi:hypothetical protein